MKVPQSNRLDNQCFHVFEKVEVILHQSYFVVMFKIHFMCLELLSRHYYILINGRKDYAIHTLLQVYFIPWFNMACKNAFPNFIRNEGLMIFLNELLITHKIEGIIHYFIQASQLRYYIEFSISKARRQSFYSLIIIIHNEQSITIMKPS